ncbi:MAG: 3-hydroxyacyl-CoA dehydrogenase family protein [Pseudomonadota bacterium]
MTANAPEPSLRFSGPILVTGESALQLSLAAFFAKTGHQVVLLDDDEAARERSEHFLGQILRHDDQPDNDWRSRIVQHITDETFPRAELLVDAGNDRPEDRGARLAALTDCLVKGARILIQTTIADISPYQGLIDAGFNVRLVSFQAPAHRAPLLEIAKDERIFATDAELETWLSSLGKVCVPVVFVDGFLANRIERRFYEGAERLLLRGALPYEIDEALVASGFSIGPFEAQDLSGLDGPYYARRSERERLPEVRHFKALVSDRMVEEGRLGKKVGVGWYRYPGGGGAVIDPLIEDLIAEEAHFAKIHRREFSADEIVLYLKAVLAKACEACLEAGIVEEATTVDRVASLVLNLPEGPLAYAKKRGAEALAVDLNIVTANGSAS